MVVYIEYALFENFILDGTLVYLTLKILRLPVKVWRLFLSATLGALFAVVFPLLPINSVLAFIVRYLFGGVICSLSISSKSLKIHGMGILFFYIFTFAFGGLLLGMVALFEAEYQIQGGYLITQVPFSLIIVFAVIFVIVILRIFTRLRQKYSQRKIWYDCEIAWGDRTINVKGLYDTGNLLTYKNTPVCLLDRAVALQFFPEVERDTTLPSTRVKTATGAREVKIFRAEIKIYLEDDENIIDKAYFALSPTPLDGYTQVILPAKLFQTEAEKENKENDSRVERTIPKN